MEVSKTCLEPCRACDGCLEAHDDRWATNAKVARLEAKCVELAARVAELQQKAEDGK